MSSLIMNVPNTAAVGRRMLCSGPRKIHITLSRKWNIILHVMMWTKTDNKRMFGQYFFDGPVNQHVYLDMCKTGSGRNWKTLALKKISASKGMEYWHITHSLLGNTLVRIPENIGLDVGHKCWLLYLTGYIEVQTL